MINYHIISPNNIHTKNTQQVNLPQLFFLIPWHKITNIELTKFNIAHRHYVVAVAFSYYTGTESTYLMAYMRYH